MSGMSQTEWRQMYQQVQAENERLRAWADDLADALDAAIPFIARSVLDRYPLIEIRLAGWHEARQQ